MKRTTAFALSALLLATLQTAAVPKKPRRSLVTDEPRALKGKPEGAADYVAKADPPDGQHLALTMKKLENGIDPARPFLIWALGSSYCNMLGNGEAWKEGIPKRFPKAPPIRYEKMVGNSCPWQYLRGWVLVGDVDTNDLPDIGSYGGLAVGDATGNAELIAANGSLIDTGHAYIGLATNETGSVTLMGGGTQMDVGNKLYVGYAGANNTLVLSDGATLNTEAGFIGFDNTAAENVGNVSGSGSVWNNAGDLYVGYAGSGNSLNIADGGKVYSDDVSIGEQAGSSNNTVLVTGAGSVWSNASDLTVGFWGKSNKVEITDGGVAYSADSVIGVFYGDNKVSVSGTNSVWSSGRLRVGRSGDGNMLEITDGGVVYSGYSAIGGAAGSDDNMAIVSGMGSIWSNSGALTVGYQGIGNTLVITNGGMVYSDSGYIGLYGTFNAFENTAVVSGMKSTWENSNHLHVGHTKSGNRLEITDGGKVISGNCAIGYQSDSAGNAVIISGKGSVLTNRGNLFVGYQGSGNSMVITNGGSACSVDGRIGNHSESDDNAVLVTGVGSVWYNREALYLGGHKSGTNWIDGGTGNSLTVQDGGWVLVGDVDTNHLPNIGSSGGIAVGDAGGMPEMIVGNGSTVSSGYGYIGLGTNGNASAVVTGAGSRWDVSGDDQRYWGSLLLLPQNLTVGYDSQSNSLVISDGGSVVNGNGGAIGYGSTSNNTALVTGSGSVWSNRGDLFIGMYGSDNMLSIADGGKVYSSNGILSVGGIVNDGEGGSAGVSSGASRNKVLVTGVGSEWNNSHDLFIATAGLGNRLDVVDGGRVSSLNGYIGSVVTENNGVSVSGAGSVWSNSADLFVGHGGRSNHLSILDGGFVENSRGSIGSGLPGLGGIGPYNAVLVTDPGSVWHNRDALYLGGHKLGADWFNGGTGNSLAVENGGWVFVGDVNTNHLPDIGNAGGIAVGDSSGAAEMIVGNGSTVSSGYGYIGLGANESGTVTVTGVGSVWSNSASLYVGYDGSGNNLEIREGGRVESSGGYVGYSETADGNAVTVSGAGSVWDGAEAPSFPPYNSNIVYAGESVYSVPVGLNVGDQGSQNRLLVSDGGRVESSGGYIGRFEGASNNFVMVSGAGSVWDARGHYSIPLIQPDTIYGSSIYDPPDGWPIYQPEIFSVGHQGSGNLLSITDGGRVESSVGHIGYGETASGNSVLVSGEGSVWNSGNLNVGYNGSENTLRIEDGGKVYSLNSAIGYGKSANSNRAAITGAESEWSMGLRSILIDPWPSYTTFSVPTNNDSMYRGYVTASDSPSESIIILGHMGTLTVGQDGSYNLLEIGDGAFVESFDGIIGKNYNAWNNAVSVLGPNSKWSNKCDLFLGGHRAEYFEGSYPWEEQIKSGWFDGGRGNSLYVGDGGLVTVGRDMHNRNYSVVTVEPGSRINIASNYYQDATSALRFGVETNAAGAPLNALVSVGGTAEFEEGATIEYASNVGQLEFEVFYTNKIVEAEKLIVAGVENAESLDLEKLDASGTLVDVIFWENDQDIYGLVGRKYLAETAGFAEGSQMARLAKEIDDMSLLGNPNAVSQIYLLNEMSGEEQSEQLTQLYEQGVPTYMHRQGMLGGQQQVMMQARAFQAVGRSAGAKPEGVAGPHKAEQGLRGWMRGYGSWADREADGSFNGFDQNVYGTIVGFDKAIGNMLLGVAGGYAQSDLTQDNHDSSDAKTGYGIIYGSFGSVDWFGDLNLSYGRSHIETRSGTIFAAKGDFDADNYALYAGGGKELRLSDGDFLFTPEAALLISYYDQEGYREKSLFVARDVDSYDRWSYQSRLGAALALEKQAGSVVLKPEVRAYWLHEFNADPDRVGYSLIGGTGGRYILGMQAPSENVFEAGAALRALFSDRLEIALAVDGQFSDDYEAITVSGRAAFGF
ncbi:MAG: autotransporter domain-containing protein [Kiritimatiellales bacterium]|nr:autotransporter domain-containing protein [Kiritimatiellales bacterium]